MFIKNLKLLNFRNYSDLGIQFNKQVNIIVGDNGQGKTNLLEAIHFSLTGESFRTHSAQDLLAKQIPELDHAYLSCQITNEVNSHEIIQKLYSSKRETFLNQKKISSGQLKKHAQSVVFSPDSLSSIKQGPIERRRLFDEILFSLNPEKIGLYQNYNRCLKTRNRVLKDYYEERQKRFETQELLESINPLYLSLASEYTLEKIDVVRRLNPQIKANLRDILGDQNVDIMVDYVISGQSAIDWTGNQVYDALYSRLQELQEAELGSGQSLVGPQKHDIIFYFNGQDARHFCSQGQQRAIVLAVKIAQIQMHHEVQGEYPVLLLDDVFSELDRAKREYLLNILEGMKAQIFITTTEIEMDKNFKSNEKSVFEIAKGKLKTPGWN